MFMLLVCCTVQAQRLITELETNSDMDMDSRPDSASTSKNKVVPVGIFSWTIDEKYGNITPADVDTLSHGFQNADLPEGPGSGHYNTLGNYGSPRMSRIFMKRKPMSTFFFTDPFDMFVVTQDRFRFYNTKSPYFNATYNWCGARDTGEDHIKVTYTNNAGKRVNIGAIFDYIYGQGYYGNQSTSFMNASDWASYLGQRYKFHLSYQHNFMKMGENGGIEDEGYITHPEEMASNYSSKDIPTLLSETWNRQEHDLAFFTHHYDLGFYSIDSTDSTNIKREFVPVTKFFHTVKFNKMMKNYRAYRTPKDYHSYKYLQNDTINDRTKHYTVKNLLGVSMCEGFNKWAVFGLTAYVGYEYNNFSLPDTLARISPELGQRVFDTKTSEHNVLIGGQLLREQGKLIHYNVDAEVVLAGENIGQFEVNGHGEANIPLFGDTAQIAVNAYLKNLNPSYYFRHFHSTHAWWDISTSKEFRQRIEGIIKIPHTKTTLTVGFENITNFCYFKNNGTMYAGPEGKGIIITNNITPLQYGSGLQVFSVNLKQDFSFGIFHLDNDFTYQTSSNSDVLPLPAISTYHNIYLKFKIARVLNTEIGGDLKYFTQYYAPEYSPVLGQFMNQHDSRKVKIGNYPIISAYVNLLLKRCRFYFQYYHANQGVGRYFWAPGYPMNPGGIRLGISWNFYD